MNDTKPPKAPNWEPLKAQDVPPEKRVSIKEQKTARAGKKRKRAATPVKRPMSEAQRAHCMSDENRARFAESIRKYREANGGKVATAKGVSPGWAGKKLRAQREEIIKMAEVKADEAIAALIENGTLKHDAAGNAVLKWAIGVVLSKDENGKSCYPVRDQLTAGKMVLEYTTAKPESKTSVRVGAEEFLASLMTKAPAEG